MYQVECFSLKAYNWYKALWHIYMFFLFLLILLLDRPPCPDGMLVVGWWYTSPQTEAKETLESVPIELPLYFRPVLVPTLLSPT